MTYALMPFALMNFFYKNIHFPLNIPAKFGIITIDSSLPLPNWGEVADSEEPHESGKSPKLNLIIR